jgi:hypothetical protein
MEKEDKKNETLTEYKNMKEIFYDKIPVTVKVLDIVIAVSTVVLVIVLAYLIIRRYY